MSADSLTHMECSYNFLMKMIQALTPVPFAVAIFEIIANLNQ